MGQNIFNLLPKIEILLTILSTLFDCLSQQEPITSKTKFYLT